MYVWVVQEDFANEGFSRADRAFSDKSKAIAFVTSLGDLIYHFEVLDFGWIEMTVTQPNGQNDYWVITRLELE